MKHVLRNLVVAFLPLFLFSVEVAFASEKFPRFVVNSRENAPCNSLESVPEALETRPHPASHYDRFRLDQSRFIPFPQIQCLINENEMPELIREYASDPSNQALGERLMIYGRLNPEKMVYHILSSGETLLMSWPVYKSTSLYPEEQIQAALFNLLTNTNSKLSFQKILQIFKFNKELIAKMGAPFPKLVFYAFQKVSFELFRSIVINMSDSAHVTLTFQLFEKIFNYGSEIEIFVYDEFKCFVVTLIKNLPDIFSSFDRNIQLKIVLIIIYWNDAENLALAVSIIPDIVFHIQKGNTLLHYATKWSSVRCLRFLLDLVHEGALLETSESVSPFAYAIGLQAEPVLEAFADHGFNGNTIIIVNTMPILAKHFAFQMGYSKSFNFYMQRHSQESPDAYLESDVNDK